MNPSLISLLWQSASIDNVKNLNHNFRRIIRTILRYWKQKNCQLLYPINIVKSLRHTRITIKHVLLVSRFQNYGINDTLEVSSNFYTHASCMQHVRRRQERQSGSSQCRKPLRRRGLCPGPHWGSLHCSHRTPSWWGGGWRPSQPRIPPLLSALRALSFGPRLSPHSKISSDALENYRTTYIHTYKAERNKSWDQYKNSKFVCQVSSCTKC